jgi:hypothetical protein
MQVRLNDLSDHQLAEVVRAFNTRYGETEKVLWCLSTHSQAALLKQHQAPVLGELVWKIRSWWGVQGAPREIKSAMARALLTLDWSPDLFAPVDMPPPGAEEYAKNLVTKLVEETRAICPPRYEYSLASKVLHWLLPWRIPVYDRNVRKTLGIPEPSETSDVPEAYARVAHGVFRVARNVTAANPTWMASLEPRSPLRAFDKCLWWLGGGSTGTAAHVTNPWQIVDDLGLACPGRENGSKA